MAKKVSKLVQVDIAGRTYSLSTTDDPEDLRLLADYVTTRILRIKRETGASPWTAPPSPPWRVCRKAPPRR